MNPMNCKKLLLSITASSVLCAGTVLASDIYRYTDENGNTIYVDRPTGTPGETRLNMSSLDTDYSAVQARVQTRHDATAAKAERAAEEGDKELTRGEKRAAAAANEQQCQGYRGQLESFITARRLFRDDANGERVYLNDEETQEARNRMEALIDENCN
jgi:hypothetical protein